MSIKGPTMGQALNEVLFINCSIYSSTQCLDSDTMYHPPSMIYGITWTIFKLSHWGLRSEAILNLELLWLYSVCLTTLWTRAPETANNYNACIVAGPVLQHIKRMLCEHQITNVITKVLVFGSNPGSRGRRPTGLCDVPNSTPAPGTSGVRDGLINVCGTELRYTNLSSRPLLKCPESSCF